MLKEKIHFSREVADVALECQNLLQEESEKEIERNYPHICTISMLVNEYFSRDKIVIAKGNNLDIYAGFKEMGIPFTRKKKSGFFNFGL